MSDERSGFVLAHRHAGAPAPVLTGVHGHGRLDGVLFEFTLRQTYRNTSAHLLEVVYTFPLPHQAVLLGFASELNGQRKNGRVVARREAERQYEDALADGDAPVMLEALAGGLHTANIGNLKPADEVVLEVRFAQMLAFEQGRLRVAIPTTIAPRYGSALGAGLQPQQVPQVSAAAQYPLALSLTVGDALAGAAVDCPTHRFVASRDRDGLPRLDLAPGAWIDRDVVFSITPAEPRPSLVVRAADRFEAAAPVTVMAALQPPVAALREAIAVKLLVDCSGSMAGDSIASARAALRGVVDGLTERDRLSLSRFGSTVQHLLSSSDASVRALRLLRPAIDHIEADLGGTEMEAALNAVFELPAAAGLAGAEVLLITDGEIWQVDAMIAAARNSRHRVFVIGVGASPAEGVLRGLAEATGGACEFAAPGEALEAAAQRMLRRMRQPALMKVRIDWGCAAAWQTAPAASVFGGDTVIAFAGFDQMPEVSAIRLLAENAQGEPLELARGHAVSVSPGASLPRIAAARRIAQVPAADAAGAAVLDLAIRYQLMSAHTQCVLVHQRADADKATGDAELHRVQSMLAAGWGASSTVMMDVSPAFAPADMMVHEMRSMPLPAMPSPEAASAGFARSYRKMVGASDTVRESFDYVGFVSLEYIARTVGQHFSAGGRNSALADYCDGLVLHPDAERALQDAQAVGLDPGQAWLLLAHWVNTRRQGLADRELGESLAAPLGALDATLVTQVLKLFERSLGSYPVDGWTLSRVGRLRRALGRTRARPA